jgi:hypothetical protein
MPYVAEFLHERRLVVIRGSGVLLGSEIEAVQTALKTDRDRTSRIIAALIDLEEVSDFRVTPDEIRQIGFGDADIAKLAPDVVLAVVAPRDYIFGMARMWEMRTRATGWRKSIFRSRPEAEACVQEALANSKTGREEN